VPDLFAGNAQPWAYLSAGRDPRLHACDRGHAWRGGYCPFRVGASKRTAAMEVRNRFKLTDHEAPWHGGAAGPALKSKPVLDLGESRPAGWRAGRLARRFS
jgi:hypothetical protein